MRVILDLDKEVHVLKMNIYHHDKYWTCGMNYVYGKRSEEKDTSNP